MKSAASVCLLLFVIFLTVVLRAAETSAPAQPHPLVWDAMEKTIVPKPDDGAAQFEFHVTNKSAEPVEILQIQPSCGCTVAEMPETPWTLAPGGKGSFKATVDFRGKVGRLSKSLYVHSTAGSQKLDVVIDIPEDENTRRTRNQQMASLDRQAVLRGDCASCHVTPAVGKTGEALFQAACGICHSPAHRASIVPDLAVARTPRDAEFWKKWITDGKEQTMMPAFGEAHGGPLTAEQITSLVEYAVRQFPSEPSK